MTVTRQRQATLDRMQRDNVAYYRHTRAWMLWEEIEKFRREFGPPLGSSMDGPPSPLDEAIGRAGKAAADIVGLLRLSRPSPAKEET